MAQGSSRPEYATGAATQPNTTLPNHDSTRFPRIAVIGAGRVGGALARSLAAQGYTISAIYNRSEANAARLAHSVGATIAGTPAEAARNADLILVTVSDSAIHATAVALAEIDLTDKAVVHTSGVTPLAALQPARERRALIGGLHPFQAIASAEPLPPGVVFGLEADREPLRGWLSGVVAAVGGITLWLRAGTDRTRYHASAVMMNFSVTLFAEALALLSRYTVDESIAQLTLLGHARRMLDNIETAGKTGVGQAAVARTLTGPLSRGDAATVRAHLESIGKLDPELGTLYRALALRTIRLAALQGLDKEKQDRLRSTLEDTEVEDV